MAGAHQVGPTAIPAADSGVSPYEQLTTRAGHEHDEVASFICGTRCAAEVSMDAHRVGRVAMSPVDVLTDLLLTVGGERDVQVDRGANHVVKHHRLSADVTACSRWFALVDQPGLVIWFEIDNRSDEPFQFEVTGAATYNVNYVSKFRIIANDLARRTADLLVVTDSEHPEAEAVTVTSPGWDALTIDSGEREPATVHARFSTHVDVPCGATGHLTIALAGSNQAGVAASTVAGILADPAAAFDDTLARWRRRTVDGPVLRTPDPQIDEFFLQSKLWAHKDARWVPLGHAGNSGSAPAEVRALTASPDYHGVFANDNAQSVWELGALGPSFYPVLDATLDVLHAHGLPESVEIDPENATGKPWLSPLRIGERPQWVLGAASLILWSGRYVDRYWPRITDALSRFGEDDADGDWLDDYSSSTFPEQPDPAEFHHEMLYASAFWYQAFRQASTVATMIGDLSRAAEYTTAAHRIGSAIEERFGSDFGYASWLDHQHRQHPHRGHTMVLPVQYGLAPPDRAALTLTTLLQPPLWSSNGPLAIEPAYPNLGADHAWGFMRWNLVHALYRHGKTDRATELLTGWAAQERAMGYPAPEAFPTITGVTGLGYVWTASRALRSMLFGLCGIELEPHGFALTPRLPTDWPSLRLDGLPFRGATYDLQVAKHEEPGIWLDGTPLARPVIPAPDRPAHHDVLIHVSEGQLP